MKSQELMIGDWVSTPYGNATIYCPDKGSFCKLQYNESGNNYAYTNYAELYSLPLTSEILAKNGINGGLWEDFYGHTLFVKNNRIKYFFDGHRRLDLPYNRVIYVHELQRAFRCCGLWELADNFKV